MHFHQLLVVIILGGHRLVCVNRPPATRLFTRWPPKCRTLAIRLQRTGPMTYRMSRLCQATAMMGSLKS